MYSEELLEKIKLVEFEAENLPQKAQTAHFQLGSRNEEFLTPNY